MYNFVHRLWIFAVVAALGLAGCSNNEIFTDSEGNPPSESQQPDNPDSPETPETPDEPDDEPTEPTEPVLVFAEEFGVDGEPDHDSWVLCPKRTSDWCDEMSESYDQAYVENGVLKLVAEKIDGTYKAGGIKTEGKHAWGAGHRIEVSARITRHPNGAFPAIWMMPQANIYDGWPSCGEIDIMEHIQQQAFIHQTIHSYYRNTLGNNNPSPTRQTVCNYGSEFVTYGLDITEERLTFYVNGTETFHYDNLHLPDEHVKKQWPFGGGATFYLILNMGLGGRPGSWAGNIDDNNLPALMEVDWVHVWKLPAPQQ